MKNGSTEFVKKERAPRNRTLTLSEADFSRFQRNLMIPSSNLSVSGITGKTIHSDLFSCLDFLPSNFIDLLIIDPPYNLSKIYNGNKFNKTACADYEKWVESWLSKLVRCLKKNASIYICCDWKSSVLIYNVISRLFLVQNRITWEREKGRGAKRNWKNCSEDIWFATQSSDYYFNVEAVKLKKKIIAPYKVSGKPKGWTDSSEGKFRLTFPSNLWSDISIPFWSMPENTDHPTQKPEKLVAKLILASSKTGDFIFDPFLGSGTTSVVANKLGRRFSGVERELEYCLLTEKRLANSENNNAIQGFDGSVFWERNSGPITKKPSSPNNLSGLFDV